MALHLVTGHEGAEHIMSADQGSFNIAAFGGGQFVLDHGNKFAATLLAGNTVRISDGDMLMQGRHIRLAAGTTEEVGIDSGTAGMLRNDLICARYTKNNSTGVEEASFVVIKGTEAASNPQDPAYNTGNITDGTDLINDFPLYRVSLNGTDLTVSDPLFAVKSKLNDIANKVDAMGEEFILINKQALSFTNNVCELTDTRITADSLADVYFTNACSEAAKKACIEVESSAGKLTLTAGRTPESTLTATIKVRVV
ncbi:MAG: hypothetical protein J5574_06320 [Lachnospiraceae bacterium]|nr:hypothetical protein [Lachnospiraceae bacterium]